MLTQFSGSIVQKIAVNTYSIEFPDQLMMQRIYESARELKSEIKLTFINSEVASTQGAVNFGGRDWTNSGNWQGHAKKGWAGGAGVRTMPKAKAKDAVSAPVSQGQSLNRVTLQTTTAPESQNGVVLLKAKAPKAANSENDATASKFTWTTVSSTGPVDVHRRLKPGASILKTKQDGVNKRGKKVKFGRKFEERFYSSESNACERLEMFTESVEQNQVAGSDDLKEGAETETETRLSTFVEAVRNKTCEELVRVLEDGPITEFNSFGIFNEQYSYVKNALREQRDEKDTKDKKTVLNIYVNAIDLIQKAFTVSHWKCFEIRIRRVSIRKLSDNPIHGLANAMSGTVRYGVGDGRNC